MENNTNEPVFGKNNCNFEIDRFDINSDIKFVKKLERLKTKNCSSPKNQKVKN